VYANVELFVIQGKTESQFLRITADSMDLRERQSVLFGKSNLHESGDMGVVILTARVVG
jgi:formate-dependent phosphoribosylglycinamide formyltransferase (GAR transformylase)